MSEEHKRRWDRRLAALSVLIWVGWAIGNLTGDQNRLTSLLFYLPSPLVAAFALGVASRLRRRSRRLTLALTLMGLISAYFVLFLENRFAGRLPDSRPGEETMRVVHWNVCRGRAGWERIGRSLRGQEADLYILSEIRRHTMPRIVNGLGMTNVSVKVRRTMGLIGRGTFAGTERLMGPNAEMTVIAVDWHVDGQALLLFWVDQDSALQCPRPGNQVKLKGLIEAHRPDIVIGDFNAPRRSPELRRLPDGYAHAYHVAGRGWSYTWPLPVPVFAIDHCLLGPRVRPLRYGLSWSPFSDHARQVLDFGVGPAQRTAQYKVKER